MATVTPIKPIRSAADYRQAVARIGAILLTEESQRDVDTLDVLSVLVHQYEETHYPMDPPDPIDAILFRLEQKGLERSDLGRLLGSRQRASEVLSRRRSLSVGMIRSLYEELGIPAEILIRGSVKRLRVMRKAVPRALSHRRPALKATTRAKAPR